MMKTEEGGLGSPNRFGDLVRTFEPGWPPSIEPALTLRPPSTHPTPTSIDLVLRTLVGSMGCVWDEGGLQSNPPRRPGTPNEEEENEAELAHTHTPTHRASNGCRRSSREAPPQCS